MANSLCKSSVFKTYQEVIADVINNVRDHFLEDGVDEMVLQELKTLWEAKLIATKAVEEVKETDKFVDSKPSKQQQQQQQQQQMQQHYNIPQSQQSNPLINKQVYVPPNNHVPQGIPFPEWRRVPIQLTIPSAPGSTEKRVLGIEVPEVFLQGHYLKSILTGTIIGETMNRPLAEASQYLQDQVNSAFFKYQQSTNFNININMGVNPLQLEQFDGCCDADEELFQVRIKRKKDKSPRQKKIKQEDGTVDSSDEDDDDDDEDNEDGGQDDEPDDDPEEGQEAAEEEPLNSEDDVSDADGTEESFETDNVVVCQYDKITRARNRWKFHLKDGIMNLNGEDFVFQKANGDAEW